MGFKTVQTNFSAGEVGPLLNMRTDTGAYNNGAKKLRNVVLLNQGGVARRSGTTYKNTFGTGIVRIIPFEFAFDEQYIMAFSNTTLKVYDTDGTLIQTITGCKWTTSQLFELTYSQAADVMIVCHQDMVTQKITRTGASTFTVADFTFAKAANNSQIYQPYYKYVDSAMTLSSSTDAIGTTTLTTSAAYFTPAHVGLRLQWFDSEIEITGYTNSTTATGDIKKILEGKLDIDPFKSTDGSTNIEVTHVAHGLTSGVTVNFNGCDGFAGLTATQLNGNRVITVIDDNTYSFTAGGTASKSVDGGGPHVTFKGINIPTRSWTEQSFSTIRGYPAAVTFHQGRLWFGGSLSQPDALWASKIYQFFNFDIGDSLDNDSIQLTIGSNDISSIKHIVSNRALQIFTATSEFYVPRISDTTITPNNITISRQTPYGSANIAPTPFDGATIFVQSSLKAVREFTFSNAEDAYSSPTLSILAEHLINSPKDMAVNYGTTKRGEQYLLLINEDGTIAQFTSSRAEKIAGWTQWNTNGQFISACTLGDKTYLVVKRGTNYYLEKLADDDLETPLDSAISYTSGTAKTVWTVSSIFAGKEVDVISNNYYLGRYTVNGSNQITLNVAVSSITVGYSFTVEIQTMPVEIADRSGSYNGRRKRISRVIMDLNETLAVSIQGNRLIIRQVNDDFSIPPSPVTDKREFYLLGYYRDASVTITQTEPLPLRLNGLAMEVNI